MVAALERVAEGLGLGLVCRGALAHDQPGVSRFGSARRHSLFRLTGCCSEPANAHGYHSGMAAHQNRADQSRSVDGDSESGSVLRTGRDRAFHREHGLGDPESRASHLLMSTSTPRPNEQG